MRTRPVALPGDGPSCIHERHTVEHGGGTVLHLSWFPATLLHLTAKEGS